MNAITANLTVKRGLRVR